MSDDQPTVAPKNSSDNTDSPQEDPTPADVPVEDDSTAEVLETDLESEPGRASADADVVEAAPETAPPAPAQQIVYVTAPSTPTRKGNRGVGSLIALASAIVFAALLAVATAIIGVIAGQSLSFSFLLDGRFYIPVLFFAVGFVLLVLILNRAAWWGYIVGSIILAVFVYFGTVGVGLLGTGIILDTPDEAVGRYAAALRDPFIIVSALLAREVALWTGALIASRGRKVKARNVEARAQYERELEEKRAEQQQRFAPTAAI
jgi:hypothetical protein